MKAIRYVRIGCITLFVAAGGCGGTAAQPATTPSDPGTGTETTTAMTAPSSGAQTEGSAVTGTVFDRPFHVQRALVVDYGGSPASRLIRLFDQPLTCDSAGSLDLRAGTTYVDLHVDWQPGTFEANVSAAVEGRDEQGWGVGQGRLESAPAGTGSRT